MEYKITVLTFDSAIPVSSSSKYSPWSTKPASIDLSTASVQNIGIEDDDDRFQHGYYSPEETQQTLTSDLHLVHGTTETVVAAGTRLQTMVGSVITSASGDRFAVMFPFRLDPGGLGAELGQRYSVLIIPLADATGAYPVLDLTESFTFTSVRSLTTTNKDSTVYATAVPDPEPGPSLCFAAGTLIRTPTGARAVETLRPGDAVWTLDGGARPLLWAGAQRLGRRCFDLAPWRRPVRVAAGALGPGSPARDLVLSPHHRVLVRSRIAGRVCGAEEVLVAIRHLVGLPGIAVARDIEAVTYCHLLLDGHHLLSAEGALAESLLPGPMALRALAPDDRYAVIALTEGRPGFAPARPLTTGREARGLARRHLKNARALLPA